MKSFLIKRLLAFILFFIPNNKLTVLTYHRIGSHESKYNPLLLSRKIFEQHLIWLSKYFNVLNLEEAYRLLIIGELPKRAVVITVDDGYIDSYSDIMPLLLKHKLTASFFISTSGIEKGYLWDELVSSAIMNTQTVKDIKLEGQLYAIQSINDKLASVKLLLESIKYKSLDDRKKLIQQLLSQTSAIDLAHQFLAVDQIKEMHQAGMTIGAHTDQHPILTLETPEVAKNEMRLSKEKLESILDTKVNFLAYPNGKFGKDFSSAHQQMAKELGFKAAFSTDWGTNTDKELYALKRFAPWEKNEFKFCMQLLMSYR